MQPRRTGSHDNPIQVEFLDILFHLLLARFGAGIADILGNHHMVQIGGRFRHFPAIHRLGDIQAAVADIDPDARLFIPIAFHFSLTPFSIFNTLLPLYAPNKDARKIGHLHIQFLP